MKRIFALALLLAFLLLSFSGCTPTLANIDDLMRPPKLSGENAGIQEAFERSTANKTVKMNTPTAGSYRSSYVLYDIDGDSEEEVITFYSDAADETAVYMHILDFKSERWESVADIKGKGSEVYKIDFCDMNGDGISEIAVCWSLFESSGNKMLTVYTSSFSGDSQSIRELVSEPFTQTLYSDVNADGNDEIFLMLNTSEHGQTRTVGKLFAMDSEFGIYCADAVELTPSLNILSLQSQAPNSEKNLPELIFADCVLDENTTVTEILYWDAVSHRLQAPLTADNRSVSPQTARTTGIASADIDKDGALEIPTVRVLPDAVSVTGDEEQPLTRTVWLGFDGEKLLEQKSCLMLYSSSYLFDFSETDGKKFSIINNISNRVCTFYRTRPDGTHGEPVFEIITVPALEWERRRENGYTVLAESSSLVYAYRIFDSGARLGVDDAYLESHFSVI